jgi:hypothetical protein
MLPGLFAMRDHVVMHAGEVGGKEDVPEQASKAVVHREVRNRDDHACQFVQSQLLCRLQIQAVEIFNGRLQLGAQ